MSLDDSQAVDSNRTMSLDDSEAIDSDRIAAPVEYFEEYLVVALLPDDAESVDDRYRRITEI